MLSKTVYTSPCRAFSSDLFHPLFHHSLSHFRAKLNRNLAASGCFCTEAAQIPPRRGKAEAFASGGLKEKGGFALRQGRLQ